jgi:hypothetical protein
MKLIDMLVEDGLNGWQWPAGVKCITQDYGSGDLYRGVVFGYREEPYLKKNIWLANSGNGHADVTIKRYDTVADDWATAIITREQYEAALAAKNEGWIEWHGGKCPLHHGVIIDAKDRDGYIHYGEVVGKSCYIDDIFWRRCACACEDNEIIAYRLHHPQEAEQIKADDEDDLNECMGQDAAPVWNGEGLPPVGCDCEVSVDGGLSWCTYRAINEKNGARLIEIGNFTEEFQNNNWIFRPICSEADKKRDEAVKTIMLTGWCQAAAEEIYDLVAAGKVPGMKLED